MSTISLLDETPLSMGEGQGAREGRAVEAAAVDVDALVLFELWARDGYDHLGEGGEAEGKVGGLVVGVAVGVGIDAVTVELGPLALGEDGLGPQVDERGLAAVLEQLVEDGDLLGGGLGGVAVVPDGPLLGVGGEQEDGGLAQLLGEAGGGAEQALLELGEAGAGGVGEGKVQGAGDGGGVAAGRGAAGGDGDGETVAE